MTCPSANVLLGFTSGDLKDAERAQLEVHIDDCAECRAALSSLVQGAAPEPRFGRYRIETVLGGGGMGLVYRAFDPHLARSVAIKVVNQLRDDESHRDRLVREAQSLARLSHRNVCQVHDVGREGDEVWVAMELIDGVDLRQWATGRRPSEVEAMLVDAARGIAAAHAVGLVHRDVKPENVLVTRDGRAVVSDFGLARHDDASASTLSVAGAVIGTPAYLAPEQLTASPLDARVDQFAWAVMTWELLTGERPFPVEPAARLAAIRLGVTRPRGLGPRLGDAVIRALAIAPRDRFESMDALVAALVRPARSRRRSIAVVAVALCGGAVLAVGLSSTKLATPPTKLASATAPMTMDAMPAVPALPSTLAAPPSDAAVPLAAAEVAPPGSTPAHSPRAPTRHLAVSPPAAARRATAPIDAPVDAGLLPDAATATAIVGPPPGPPVETRPVAQARAGFNRARAERRLAVCRFPVDPARPDRALVGQVVDWGPITRRDDVRGRDWRMMKMYEVNGAREVYRIDGASLVELGVLEAELGDLIVVCADQVPPRADVHGEPMPPPWSRPSRPIYAFAPAAVVPRTAEELKPLAVVHVSEATLRDFAAAIPPALAPRNLLVWAAPTSVAGPRWEMNGWSLDAGDLPSAALLVGQPVWLVVDRPSVEGSPGNRRAVLHAVRALRSLLQ